MSAYAIDDCWQAHAERRYELLTAVAPLSKRIFRRAVSHAIAEERDRKMLRCLNQLCFEPGWAVSDAHPDYFATIAGAWANYRMDAIDRSVGEPRAISDLRRREARYRSLANLSACYLVMRAGEGCPNDGVILEIANAALAYPPAPASNRAAG